MNYRQMLDKFAEIEQRMRDLEASYVALQDRVYMLESRHRTYGPLFTPGTVPEKFTLGCHMCGLGSDGAMGYACPRSDCPSAVRCVGDMQ